MKLRRKIISAVLAASMVAGLVPAAAGAAPAQTGLLGPAPSGFPAGIPTPGPEAAASDRAYMPGEILVRFAPGASASAQSKVHSVAGGVSSKKLGTSVDGLMLVKLAKGVSVEEALADYEKQPGVIAAQPNRINRINAASVDLTPGDPKFPLLWGLKNTGQKDMYGQTGIVDADIDADEAWGLTTGSKEVTVAVIDTGVDRTHPDLDGNMWVNTAEIPGNNIDDDGNGYKDDVYGWDAVNEDGDPSDDHGHGTHVSGTIGGEGDNSVGVTGVNWKVKIVAIKAFSAGGTGTDADCIEAIDYAKKIGADIVNASWSGGGEGQGDLMSQAIAANPALFACAAGNEGTNLDAPLGAGLTDTFPAEYNLPNIISVGASDNRDTLAEFSNYGATTVDIAAPGVGIWSSVPGGEALLQSGSAIWSENWSGSPNWRLSYAINPWYLYNEPTFYSGAPFAGHVEYENNEQSALIWGGPGVNVSSLSRPALFYKTYYDTEDDYDFLEVYIKSGATGLWYLDAWETGWSVNWVERFVNLAPYKGETSITPAFQLYSDDSYSYADEGYLGACVDDVRISNSVPNWNLAYDGWDGTSMATPHVAGAAALLLAYDPTLDAVELRSVLMNSSDVKSSLGGQVSGNRRLNVYRALQQVGPGMPTGAVARVSGSDRFAVAAAMARKGWDPTGTKAWTNVNHVIVANGENGKEADPLAAAGLAGAYNGPVLLTQASRTPNATKALITEIAAKRKAEGKTLAVHIIGGTASVPDARWKELKAIPGVSASADRIAGADRYQVSANIATRIVSRKGRDGVPAVLLIAADNPAAFYDALAASPAAYAASLPMLSVKKGSVPTSVKSALNGVLAGKPRFAVSSSTYIGSGGLAGAARLTSSSNRYTAATQIASNAVAKGWLSPQETGLAAKLPDALTGGAFLGKRGGVMLFTDSTSAMQPVARNWITARASQVKQGWVLGGTASVPGGVETTFRGLVD